MKGELHPSKNLLVKRAFLHVGDSFELINLISAVANSRHTNVTASWVPYHVTWHALHDRGRTHVTIFCVSGLRRRRLQRRVVRSLSRARLTSTKVG